MRQAKRLIVTSLILAISLVFAFRTMPGVYADTFGTTSIAGLAAYSNVAGWIWSAKFVAPSGGPLVSISLFVTAAGPSATGNVGIYSDSGGKPGALLAQGTAQALTNGVVTFSSLSASVTIVSGTSYWLAFEMTGASMYFGGSGTRSAGAASCCTLPSTGVATYMYSGTYGIYATYNPGTTTTASTTTSSTTSTTPSYNFNVKAGATQIVVTVSWVGSGSATIVVQGPGGTPSLSESGAVVYDRTTVIVVGGSTTQSYIHRATFVITPPSSAETWTLLLTVSTTTYTVTIEVS